MGLYAMTPLPSSASVPTGYDPVTFNHWLWYKYLCHEGTATDFQRLFENIMKRARPDFMQIRPYGRIGDRKADGLLVSDSTVFQVYSPDTLTQAKVIEKIDEDLGGAVAEWGEDMEKWVFVYNARRGLPPDIPKILKEKQRQYPEIAIDHLSSDGLWEVARELPLQKRVEVLGAPVGYEGNFLVPNIDAPMTADAVAAPSEGAWLVIIQDVLKPVDVQSILRALQPDKPFGAPTFVRPDNSASWQEAAVYQRDLITDLLLKCRDSLRPRFAVFSIAPIPLILHLGFLLSDSVLVRPYKLHIDTVSWEWPERDGKAIDDSIQVSGVPENVISETCEVLIRVSLSERVGEYETGALLPDASVQVDIFVDNPSLTWIRSPRQLKRLAEVFRRVLSEIRRKVPFCQRIHLFAAVPAPAAVVLGQQLNPRMNPPVCTYQYSRQKVPRYELALTLGQEGV